MLSVIISQSPVVRDAFVSALSLEKQPQEEVQYSVYKRGRWILVFAPGISNIQEIVDWSVENYLPIRIYLPLFGKAIDIVREIGDIIMPNVLLSYNSEIESTDLNKENRDTYFQDARFLEIYDEQKDYYVEDYGLSIGGIIVDCVPESADPEKLMVAYEADVYIEGAIGNLHEVVISYDLPIVITTGIISGKKPKNITLSPLDHTVRNMITTFRLLEGE